MTVKDGYFLIEGHLFAPQSSTSEPARLVVSNNDYYVEINRKKSNLVGEAVSYTHLTLPTTPYV